MQNPANKLEDSFDYFIRHTCWRPRDLITLCSESIERFCDHNNIGEIEFFQSNIQLSEDIVRTVVSEKSSDIGSWRLIEFTRKYSNSIHIEEIFTVMPTPTTIENLLSKANVYNDITNVVGGKEFVRQLWDTDIIGICILVESETELERIIESYGDTVVNYPESVMRGSDEILGKIFLFRYNTRLGESPLSIMGKYSKMAM